MTKLTFIQLAEKILAEEKRPLSAVEIWDVAKRKGYDQQIGSKGKTPWATISAQIYVDMRKNPNSSKFAITDTKPRKFYLREIDSSNDLFDTNETSRSPKQSYLEKELHPFLAYYVYKYMKAHVKTINAQKSEKKGLTEWIHPDAVGCYFLFNDWKDEVADVSIILGQPLIRLYSFELKRDLNSSNIREAFFQAVSNSSWANEGYLVASNIESKDDFRAELKRLSAAFSIGVINLHIEDPDSSEVILPAKSKENVDWETVNKLTINPDFSAFLKRVKNDISTREVRKEEYDEVKTIDELQKIYERIISKTK